MTQNYVIVGGSHGIGLTTVKVLPADSNIYVLSRTKENLEGLSNVHHIYFDALSSENDFSSLPESIDALVYCPGSISLKPFHRFSEEELLNDLRINYLGAVQVLQASFRALKKGNNAGVVLISTVAVQTGMPFHASIAAAKGAVEGLGRSLAAEWAPNIRVNVVAPALVNTRLSGNLLSTDDKKEASNKRHPLNRYGETNDIASAILFLLSKDASWVTGQVLGVDGGMSSLKA